MKTLILLLTLAGCQDLGTPTRAGEVAGVKLGTPVYAAPAAPAPSHRGTIHYDCGTRGGRDGNTAYCNKIVR
jgi:hypothetical protein